MEQGYHKTGFIHETLGQQTPDREELRPSKERELDRDFAESVPSHLAVDFERLAEMLKGAEIAAESIKLDWCEGYLQLVYERGGDVAIKELLEIIQHRIREATNLFHDFDEAMSIASDISGLASSITKEPRKSQASLDGDYGMYEAVTRTITISDELERGNTLEEISSLMGDGLPLEFSMTFHHELLHAIQFKDLVTPRLYSKFGIDSVYERANANKLVFTDLFRVLFVWLSRSVEGMREHKVAELSEAHAFQDSPYNHEIIRLIDRLENGYDFKDRDRVIAAIRATKQLIALNLPKDEIGRIILSMFHWDKKTGSYPKIQAYIAKKLAELHLTEDDLENLMLAERIEAEIQRNRAMIIARLEVLMYCNKRFGVLIVPEAIDKDSLKNFGIGVV